MKLKFNLLLVAIITALFCSVGNAQIIYSNNFAIGGAVNISNTPPTLANSFAGGTNGAFWNDVLGVNNTGALLANGTYTPSATLGDTWLLPFKPQTNHVYLVTAVVTWTNDPLNWVAVGFAQNDNVGVSVANGFARFSDNQAGGTNSPRGYDFVIARAPGANEQWFSGPGATPAAGLASANPVNAFGTWTIQLLLDTRAPLWSADCFINGAQFGTNFVYTANPGILGVGIGQNTLTDPTYVQWNNFALSATLQPFVTRQPTPSQILSSGVAFTNSVGVTADTNGGTLFYQWYANGTPLVNGGSVSGANTNVLVINPATTANQGTNYYVIVSNNFGSSTSSVASLVILTNPVVSSPAAPTNFITLFSGGGGNVGSSPTFSVIAGGAPPLVYQWLTNGVVVGSATGASLSLTNLQAGGPTSFVCVVSNGFGAVSNTWLATYTAAPVAAYPQAVLTDKPLDFWRLNEPDDGIGDGNPGALCHDYQSGNNGVYTNVSLGQPGYNALEPAETSMFVTVGGAQPSCVSRITGLDLAATMTNGVNAAFTVEAWASCVSGNGISGGAPVVSQGVLGASSFFLGVDTNSSQKHYQFYVRSAGGTLYSADDATVQANDLNWHYLVGVCDEAHTNVSLYIDGRLTASVFIPANSGNFESGSPVAIGAGIRSGSSDFNVPFTGNIDDVAIYDHALSTAQVISHFGATGSPVPVSFIPPPPTNVVYLANKTLTIPATVAGSGPFGYSWINVTAGGVLGSGQTSISGSLDATLTIPNASAALSGDQLELIVTNAVSSTNWFVTLFSPAPPVALDYSDLTLYSNVFNGGAWSIAGMPLTAANSLVGGTNSLWVDALGTNDTGSLLASGVSATPLGDSWLVPFTPHAGYVYTMTASVTFSGNPNNWVGLGFAQNIPTNATAGRLSDSPINCYSLIILTESSGQVQYFAGPGTGGTITNKSAFFTAGVGTHAIRMVMDTTAAKWKVYAFVDGVPAGTNTYTTNPTNILGAGLTQNALNPIGLVQWNSFTLSQVAPGGVPPYLFAPVPSAVTLLPDASLSLSASAFGSAPFGYYWSNTNTGAILGSGATNNMAPLGANLSIADVPASWNGNTLALVVTNAFGTNISLVSLIVTSPVIVPTNSATITAFSLVGGTNVMISATNGQSGGTYYLRGSTNLLTPLGQWLPVATNIIITDGGPASGFTFMGTNVIQTANPQQFYFLSNTN